MRSTVGILAVHGAEDVKLAPSPRSTLLAGGGEKISVQDWFLAPQQKPRAAVLLVHGLGEHIGRYQHVARYLNEWGFSVRGYDQYGHGESSGPRGGLPSDGRLLDDLVLLVERTRADLGQDLPLVLLGHSMGGLVAVAASWNVPTLLMYAGADKLVNPAGSRAFAAAAPVALVRSHCFESLYHEIFNELDAKPVFAELMQWLDARF